MLKNILSRENRALLYELVRTDFKLRYQGSVLGYFWSLLKPLMMFTILYVVFVRFLRIGAEVPHYPIYLLLGVVIWNFFSEMTSQSLSSIVGRGDLIRKIRIPRWIVVISASVSALINVSLNLVVIGGFLLLNHVDLSWRLILLPLSLVEVYVFGLGISFFLAAAYVKFRDVVNIWEILLQAGFYVTPVLYPLALVKNVLFQKILLLNPVAQAIQDARYNIVTKETITTWNLMADWKDLIPMLIVAFVFVIGVLYFKKESTHFAENL